MRKSSLCTLAVVVACLWVQPAGRLSGQEILLGDITLGGDGTGNAPAGNIGIDPRNGAFVTAGLAGTIMETDAEGDGINPSPAQDSDYIDSVFIIGPAGDPPADPTPQAITQSGVTFDFPLVDATGTGYNFIFGNRGADNRAQIRVAGLEPWPNGVGIHASMGITYDLDAIRSTHGAASVGCLQAAWGVDDCGIADINIYCILSNDAGVLDSQVFPSARAESGELLQMQIPSIPSSAKYLTFAVGSNGVDWCDHGGFANARIVPGTCPATRTTALITVAPEKKTIGSSAQLQLLVRGLDTQSYPFDATKASTGTVYSVSPAGVVSVSADGLVSAISLGTADVTATNGTASDKATITVSNDILLSDITAGGDGRGSAPAGNVGIDPRNGLFVTAPAQGTIRETDAGADGVNPSPTASEFIDSVFFIGPLPTPPTNPFPQVITQSGKEFQFPQADGIGTGWNYILANLNAGSGDTPFRVGGITTWGSGVGIHSSTGITYDLRALRARHGAGSVGCFSTSWGMCEHGGDVILYAILSSDAGGILSQTTYHATQNSGAFVQIPIPGEAEYLTLATGSNGADGSDHGNFAEPTITGGACPPPPIVSLDASPAGRVLAKGKTVQLQVKGSLASGFTLDLTASSTGTVYSIVANPAGSITVSAEGLVTGVDNGQATVTVTNGAFSDTCFIAVQDFIDLGNIAAGGNGKLPPADPNNIGINADTGIFAQARINVDVPEANGLNPQPVDGTNGASTSSFIDSVFIMDVGVAQTITAGGVTFDFDIGDVAGGWENILDGREPGGPDYLQLGAAGPYTNGVGLHAAQGITYNLQPLRFAHGSASVKYFSAVMGECSGTTVPGGRVSTYAILSDDAGVIESRSIKNVTDSGEFVQLEIPSSARYLTLAVGAAGDGINADHGGFGQARISATAVDMTNLSELRISPPLQYLTVGGEALLSVKGILGASEYAGLAVSIDPAAATFTSDDSAVATVDATGKVSGAGTGRTKVRATVGLLSAAVEVVVGDVIKLGDVTAGGDGLGTAPFGNLGVDPRNGNFVTASAPGPIRETDVDGDGVNPSPVADSDYIDSVFFIGPPGDLISEPFPQAITQSGVEFGFPRVDGIATGYNFTFANAGADYGVPLLVGGINTWTSGVGCHSSTGITYDINALRGTHGGDAVDTFLAYWGVDGCGTADINLYAILSNDSGIVAQQTYASARVGFGQLVELKIPPEADYLTLAVGSNGADGCDHGNFGEAMIVPAAGGTGPVFHRGDADQNDALELTDAIQILGYLFLGSVTKVPQCEDAADADDNGSIELTDAIRVLGYLFLGTGTIPAPGPTENACGPDPVTDPADPLGCNSYDSLNCQ